MKIVILRGIKGSGKTKYAMEGTRSDVNSWSVSKSAIRKSVYDGIYAGVRENVIKLIYWETIECLIANVSKSATIYLDNLNIKDLNETIEKLKDIFNEYCDKDVCTEIRVITFKPTLTEALTLARHESPDMWKLKETIAKQYDMAKAFGIYEDKPRGVQISYEDFK